MSYRDIIKERFSSAAAGYDARADFQAEAAEELLRFMRPMPSIEAKSGPKRILDAGCGTGRLISELLGESEYKSVAFFGLDIARPMLIEARGGMGGKRGFVNAACEAMPFGTARFSHVVSNLAYQWVSDLRAAFSEVERVLEPGGSFSFSTLGQATLNELQTSLEIADSDGRRFSFTAFAGLEVILEALAGAGLQLVNVREETLLRFYKTPLHLLKRLKETGTSARGEVLENSLSRGTFIRKVLNIYEREFAEPDGTVRATYELILITAKKGF